ncbi:Asparagine--tRNA ligase, cytoplasmic 1 [Linum perenne]
MTDVIPSELVLKHQFSHRVPIRSIVSRPDGGAALAGQRVRVGGWVKTGREQGHGRFAFLAVNDGSCLASLQVIIDASVSELGRLLATGTSISVDGMLKVPPEGTTQKIELRVEQVLRVGPADPTNYPIPKTKFKHRHSLEFLRDHIHFRPRTDTISSIARIRNALEVATHSFFQENGFLSVKTPIITTSDCEGAGEMFQVSTLFSEAETREKDLIENPPPSKDGKIDYAADFFGRQAFLTVSGQLQLETYTCGVGNVYTFGPTFRAENSHTSRHLAEFWMVEPEIAFADLQDDMNCAEAYVKYMCCWLLEKCYDDMEHMVEFYDKGCIERLRMVSTTPFERISYTEAVKILEEAIEGGTKFDNRVEWGIDLSSEHERFLTEVKFQKPVILYNYPKGIKAFYMRLNDDSKTVAAMDVLVPKVGELIGGSQREERYDVIKERILEMGLDLERYEWYLDLRRFGTIEHSGFGLGFERMMMFATGIDNIRDVIPFPRYPGRADL